MELTQEEETEKKFKELILKDTLINNMFIQGASEKQMVVALAHVIQELSKLNTALYQITPRKIKGPDGTVFVWRCPESMIPENLEELISKENV